MTREEAIRWINDRMCWGRGKFTKNHPPTIDKYWEAGLMAIDALKDTRNCILTLFGDCSYDETGCSDCEIKQTIYKALSVDLVRCGECVHWYNDADTGTACEFTNMHEDADDFCSYGERRSDD